MQWIKNHAAISVIALVAVVSLAVWFGFLFFDTKGAFDTSEETGWIHEECDFTDYYYNQHMGYGGVCTHDLSYTEPEIPAGRYYPNGDASAPYYMEISKVDGKNYFEYKNPDGSNYGDSSSEFYGKKPYTVHTFHIIDSIVLCNKWHERSDEDDDEFSRGLWPGEKIVLERDNVCRNLKLHDDGSVEIEPYNFSENYNQSDIHESVYLSIPRE